MKKDYLQTLCRKIVHQLIAKETLNNLHKPKAKPENKSFFWPCIIYNDVYVHPVHKSIQNRKRF